MANVCRPRGWGGRVGPCAAGVVLLAGLFAAAAAPGPPVEPTASVKFDSDATTVPVGRTRVVAFRVADPSESDRSFAASVGDAPVLSVIREPAVVGGSAIGFARVRGLRAGETNLTIDGVNLRVRVVAESSRPQFAGSGLTITCPATGAAVWGTITVGVEWETDDTPTTDSRTPIRLRLSTGQVIEPSASLSPRRVVGDPTRRVTFEIDTSAIPAGPLELAVTGADGKAGAETLADPVVVRIIHPTDADLTAGEAEAAYEVERPERFKRARLRIGADPAASGGKFLDNASPDPAMCFPIHVESPGAYQVVIVAGGTLAGGALPTVGLVVDGQRVPATNARLVSESWHRLALGIPVRLLSGDHVLTPYFTNDFYVGGLPGKTSVDRNLKLDRIEVVRMPDSAGAAAAGGDGVMAQSGPGAMTDTMMAGAGQADDGGVPLPDDPMGVTATPLRIALQRPLDGLPLTGDLEVEAQVWMDGVERGPVESFRPPTVTLLFNGQPIGTQRSVAPRFVIDSGRYRPAANTVEFVARLGASVVTRTPPQSLTWSPPAGATRSEPRRSYRFTVHDERWDASIRARFTREQGPRERVCAAFASNGEAVLSLPDDMAGRFDLSLDVRGQDFKGPAIATSRLKHGEDAAEPLGEVKAQGGWSIRRVGDKPIEFKPGPKQLTVAFENDLFEPPQDGKGGGDRNLYLQAVVLSEAGGGRDQTPPMVAILYPPPEQPAFGADAVVATAVDDRSLASVELLIDGAPTGQRLVAGGRPGRAVFPLSLRSLSPGPHTLAVRATDKDGNTGISDPRTLSVLATPPPTLGTYERALRLLDRFAFGPDPGELASILTMGDDAWLNDRLSRAFDDPADEAALGAALVQFPGRNPNDVQRRALLHALLTPNPVRARFVLWTENHFSTWVRKTEGPRKWSEHVEFSRLGAAPFYDLLLASARSPAMLRYLDQENSYAAKLNENYAREIMELHTLGVRGGYTQQDVTSLAHLLTGWTTAREGDGRSGGESVVYNFRFDPLLNDRAPIRIIGVDFPPAIGPVYGGREQPEGAVDGYDRIRLALETLAAHPSTARFVSRKLAEHYVGCPAPDALVEDLASVFTRTGGDLREMLLAIAHHSAFWASASAADPLPAPRMAHPFDFSVRLSRETRRTNANQVSDFLSRCGHGLFDRATPDGYPEADSAYTDSNAMVQRWRFAQELAGDIAALVPDTLRQEPPKPAPKDADQPAAPQVDPWAQQVIDLLAVRLTGRLLSDESNQAALDMLNASTGRRQERIAKFAPFIAQLPEANLR